MRTRTRASSEATIDEGGETNWAAAAAASSAEPAAPAPAPAPAPAMNDDLLTHDNEEEEEWVNTGVENEDEDYDDEDYDDEEPVLRHEHTVNRCPQSQSWILKVAIPDRTSASISNGNSNCDSDNWGSQSANIFIDSGMTAERLGRCILQAVPSTSMCLAYSQEYNDNDEGRTTRHNHRSSRSILVGLFGTEDRVFYSLECILAMDPAEGVRRLFCVTKPICKRGEVATTKGAGDDRGYSLFSIFSYVRSRICNLPVALVVLFVAMFLAPMSISVDHFDFDDWNQFLSSLLPLVPPDVPSLWRTISFVFDWPAREMYRYGPSLVGMIRIGMIENQQHQQQRHLGAAVTESTQSMIKRGQRGYPIYYQGTLKNSRFSGDNDEDGKYTVFQMVGLEKNKKRKRRDDNNDNNDTSGDDDNIDIGVPYSSSNE